MNYDFSRLNSEYLIHAHELATDDVTMSSVVLGADRKIIELLAAIDAEALSHVSEVTIPLIVMRNGNNWWEAYLRALRDHRMDEVHALIDQVALNLADR